MESAFLQCIYCFDALANQKVNTGLMSIKIRIIERCLPMCILQIDMSKIGMLQLVKIAGVETEIVPPRIYINIIHRHFFYSKDLKEFNNEESVRT